MRRLVLRIDAGDVDVALIRACDGDVADDFDLMRVPGDDIDSFFSCSSI